MITGEFLDGYVINEDAYKIRKAVFIDELKTAEIFLEDEVDASAHHLLVKDGKESIATGRIVLDDEKTYIGRIAVMKSHRGQSIGDLVVKMLIDKAFRLGLEPVSVYSRISAIGFYESIGFKTIGEVFTKESVEVVEMTIRSKDLIKGCNK